MGDCFQTVIGHVWTSALSFSLLLFLYHYFITFLHGFSGQRGKSVMESMVAFNVIRCGRFRCLRTHPGLEHDFIFLQGTTAIQLSSLMITINTSSLLLIIRFQGGQFL